MQALSYYLFSAFMGIIYLLPMRVLYFFSDILYLITFYLIRYRRAVVQANLRNSFPELSQSERQRIEKAFYRHLADNVIEVTAMVRLNTAALARRYRIVNPEIIEQCASQGRNLILAGGHYGNWDWICHIGAYSKYRSFALYKPLKDKRFDKQLRRSRSRYGMQLEPPVSFLKAIRSGHDDQRPVLLYAVADQSPMRNQIEYRTTFLNQDTPMWGAIERFARLLEAKVYFVAARKVKRGYYELSMTLLTDAPSQAPKNSINTAYDKALEAEILRRPELWLWSHRRWKHRPDPTPPAPETSA